MHEEDNDHEESTTIRIDEAAAQSLLNESHEILFVPRHKLARMASPQKPASSCIDIMESALHPSTLAPEEVDPTIANKCGRSYSLRVHMVSNAWDVIHKEVMDWRDSSWPSMHLPGNRMCTIFTTQLSLEHVDADVNE